MKKLFRVLALLALPLCALAQNPSAVGPVDKSPHLAMGRPGAGLPGNTLIARRGYACLHSAQYKTPLWVSYRITRKDSKKTVDRVDAFQADPDLSPGFRAEISDYVRSGFDRGHMASSKDMGRDLKTQGESFYLSNIVPQDPKNNQKFWKAVEDRFREYVKTYGSLYIISGPIFGKPLPTGCKPLVNSIGNDHVGVPTWLFKIAMRKLPNGHYTALALEVPNVPVTDVASDYHNAMSHALVSIDTIEADAGLDFLNALPITEQQRLESKAAPGMWSAGAASGTEAGVAASRRQAGGDVPGGR